MPIPTFITARLSLRQLSIDDYQDIFALRSDMEINKYLGRPLCSSTEEAKNFINKINVSIDNGDAYYWAITLLDEKIFLGTICLYNFSSENQRCEIGYELMPKYQGHGIMKEAVKVIIEFVFNNRKWKEIIATSHRENKASTGLLLGHDFIKKNEAEDAGLLTFSLSK